MSPRSTGRDFSAVRIKQLEPGRFEDDVRLAGGFILLGGPRRVEIDDPGLDYVLEMTPGVERGRLVCAGLLLRRRAAGPPVTGKGLRQVPVDAYLRTIIAASPWVAMTPSPGIADWPSSPAERGQAVAAQGWQPPAEQLELRRVADTYRRHLANPATCHRPTAATAEELRLSRGHTSRLVTRARREGLLGAARPGVSGEEDP